MTSWAECAKLPSMTTKVTKSCKLTEKTSEVLFTRSDRPGNVMVLKPSSIGHGWDWEIYYSDILIYDGFYAKAGRSIEETEKQALLDAEYFLDGSFPIGYFQDCTDNDLARESFNKYRFDRA